MFGLSLGSDSLGIGAAFNKGANEKNAEANLKNAENLTEAERIKAQNKEKIITTISLTVVVSITLLLIFK